MARGRRRYSDGLGYTLFVKPLATTAAVIAVLAGVYLLPEYWPDHALAADAIGARDDNRLARYLARGLHPDDRSQWRSYLRRTIGRATGEGVGSDTPALGPADEPLLVVALATCDVGAAARLVRAGASPIAVSRDGTSALERAAGCDGADVVARLLAAGADVNAASPDGGTVLWEPTGREWRRRPFSERITVALEAAGAVVPARRPVRR
ncbi:MAG: hypothetical protein AB7U83_08565 [Vicinamibacterales bacterium]